MALCPISHGLDHDRTNEPAAKNGLQSCPTLIFRDEKCRNWIKFREISLRVALRWFCEELAKCRCKWPVKIAVLLSVVIKIRLDVEVARVGAPLLAAVPLAGCRALACYATDVSLHRCARAALSHQRQCRYWCHTIWFRNILRSVNNRQKYMLAIKLLPACQSQYLDISLSFTWKLKVQSYRKVSVHRTDYSELVRCLTSQA